MNRILNTHMFVPFALLFLTTAAHATASARYVCAARVDCGAPALPSTQDLPVDRTPTVKSTTVEAAREKCVAVHSAAYVALAKTIEDMTPTASLSQSRGCRIVAEAFRE
jgi:hypothetical protein